MGWKEWGEVGSHIVIVVCVNTRTGISSGIRNGGRADDLLVKADVGCRSGSLSTHNKSTRYDVGIASSPYLAHDVGNDCQPAAPRTSHANIGIIDGGPCV